MPHSPAFLDHLQHPRGHGRIVEATHRAVGEDAACGDRLELDLVIAAGVVARLRWRADGCSGTLAAASALAVLGEGCRAHPEAITREALDAELGGLPPARRHALRLAARLWREALEAPRRAT